MTFYSLLDLASFDQDYFRFRHLFREVDGYRVVEKDGKMHILINAMGIDEKDISVEHIIDNDGKETIVVGGSTKNEFFNRDSLLDMKFYMQKHVEEIHYKMFNGYLILEISFKEPVKSSVKVIKD
jgi:hypothetical protein